MRDNSFRYKNYPEHNKKKTNTMCYHLHAESKKRKKRVNITKQKETYREQTSGYQRGEGRGKGK